jgi:phosphatidylglycerol lysyltransferase
MAEPRKKKKSRFSPPLWLRIVFGIIVLVGAGWLLRDQLKEYTFASIMEGLRSLPPWRVAGSIVFSILGYFALIGHDVLGLSHLRKKVALHRTALAGFVTYAFSNSAPVSFAVAGAIRFRFYSRWGLHHDDTSHLVGLSLSTYALGMLASCAITLTVGAFPLPGFVHLPLLRTTMPLGIFAGLLLIGYIAWTAARGKALGATHTEELGPTLGFTASQLGVSLADWGLSAAALWVLVVHQHPLHFFTFFGVFMLGQIVSLIAHMPGGLGVLDAVIIWGLKAAGIPGPATLAALFGYRVIYYLVPLLLATGLWFYFEGQSLFRRGAIKKKKGDRRPKRHRSSVARTS